MTGPADFISFSACTLPDFAKVKQLIAAMCLDNNDLWHEQFITATREGEVLGFGRLRIYAECQELCSLGVVKDFRRKGIGSAIMDELIRKRQKPLYAVTVIPDFFSRSGFKTVTDYPTEIGAKLDYCRSNLSVPEPYVVMKLEA